MIDAPLALAFTAGMIATINPCGFALLPACIGAFVAGDDTSVSADRRIAHAVGVSAAVSVGFAAMLIIVGVAFSTVSAALRQQMPWVTIAVGLVMAAMGIASIGGWRPRLPVRKYSSMRRHNATGMATFGCVYALVSLSCTLGPFLSVSTLAMQRSFFDGIATYVVYATGMGAIILALSVSAALAHDSFVGTLRNASKYASRLAGVLLLVSGGYAIWYGRYELSVYDGNRSSDSLVEAGTMLQIRFVQFTQSVGAERIGLTIVGVTVVAYTAFRIRNRNVASLEFESSTRPQPAPVGSFTDREPSRETTSAP